jgi:hypothetical protein
MFYCAQYDANGRVFSVAQLSSKMVEISSNDQSILGTFYNETDKKFHGFNITLTADKATILADGTDASTITATVNDYLGAAAATFTDLIVFNVNGVITNVTPTNGVATLQVKSATAGALTVKTENAGYVMNNDSISVTAS